MDLNNNILFAAVLVAGITASGAYLISNKVMKSGYDKEDAVPVEGVEVAATGAIAAPKGPDPILHLIATADVARGERLSRACAACHSFDKGGPNRIGPNMWNVIGGPKAHIASFAYSDALQNMAGEWGYLEMNKFLYKPKEYIPGTKMNYIGMRKPEDRAAIIAWMRTLSDSPAALPTEAQIAAEYAELAPPEPEPAEEEEAEESDVDEGGDEGEEASEEVIEDAS